MKPAFQSSKNKGSGLLVPLFFGVLAGVAATFSGAVLSAVALSKLALPANFVPFSIVSLALGSFVFGILLARQHRTQRFFFTGIASLIAGSLLLLLRLLCSPAPFAMETWIKLAAVMFPLFFAAFLVKTRTKQTFSRRG